MFKIQYCTVAVAMLGAIAAGAAAQQPTHAGALPPAVKAAFAKAYPKATVDHWAAEQREGQAVFEVESHEGQQKRDLLYSAGGHLIESEEAVAVAELPSVVRQALKEAYPHAIVQHAERVVRGQVIEYEVLLKGAGVKEVVLSAGGSILKTL